MEGMEAKLKRQKTRRFFGTQPTKKPAPARWPKRLGLVRGRLRRYNWSTLMNNYSNLSEWHVWHFLVKIASSLLTLIFVYYCQRHKKNNYLHLSKVTSSIWSFRIPTSICCTKNCTISVCFHPLTGWGHNQWGSADQFGFIGFHYWKQ